MNEYITNYEQNSHAELIRCKDCKYYAPLKVGSKSGTCPLSKWVVNGEHYCSWAERKEQYELADDVSKAIADALAKRWEEE